MKVHWDNIRGDLVGGLNVGVVALPLAIAFGVESGLGAIAGLIAAIVVSLVGATLGGSPWLISGPTVPVTVVSSVIIASELDHAATHEAALATIFMIFLLSGAFQIVFGLLRFGEYARFVPYPLVSGFQTGIGIMLVLFQLLPLFGYPMDIHFGSLLMSLPGIVKNINWSAFGLGAGTVLIIYLFPKGIRTIPSTLIAMVTFSLVAYYLSLDVPTIGQVPSEWIRWRWSNLLAFDKTHWSHVLKPALTLAILASIDTLLTTLVTGMFIRSRNDNNRQLMAQGLGNIFSALAGGLPGAGATLRTVLNIRSGGKSILSSLTQGLFLLLFLLKIGSFLKFIPLSIFAAILITVGVSIIDYKSLRDLHKIPRSDAVVMIAVIITTVAVGLLEAFAFGIILASLFFVKKMADQSMGKNEPILLIPEMEEMTSTLDPMYLVREVQIHELRGPLFFGYAAHFKEAFQAELNTRAVIFRMERVPFIDHSGMYVLKEVFLHLRQKKIVVLLSGLQPQSREELIRMNIIPTLIREEWIFSSFSAAADWLGVYLKEHPDRRLNKASPQQLGLDHINDRMN